MKLSIIIPTLNEQFYLPQLLAALEKQSFRDFEIIIVDGKSRDKTVLEAAKFNGRLPDLRIIEGQRGISRQRNLGARESHSSYLLFLDADVIPAPSFLSVLVKEVEKRKLDSAMSFLRPITDSPFLRLGTVLIGLLTFKLIFPIYKNTIGADFFVRREAFEKVDGFDESLVIAEDNDLLRRLLKADFSYKVLFKPKIQMSMRRFERDGYLPYLLKTLVSMILIFFLGTHRAQRIIRFEFGSHPKPKK